MAFIQRLLSARFQLGTRPDGTPSKPFVESGTDVMTVSGLRMSARIAKAHSPVAGTELSMVIYGMTLSQMNQLATLGMVYSQIFRNSITVLAGDTGTPQFATVFVGTILQAWIDFSAQPSVAFHIEAQGLAIDAVVPATPTSIKSGADVAQLMQGFATQMGCTFENSGINAKLPSSYFYGSPANQAAACARAAGINWFVDNGVLAIWPQGKSRNGVATLISPQSGLIGFPSFTDYGIALRTVFNPDVRFQGQIELKSSLQPTNGSWTIYTLHHYLDSQVGNGKWFTDMTCYNQNHPIQVKGS